MAAGQVTSVELVEHLLERIERREPSLHALIAVHPQALEQARAADDRRAAGQALGPLDGIPVIIKDNIECVGLPATVGSLAMVGSPAERDAPLVTRLRAAGMVVLAAANLSEWANFRGRHSTSGWSGVGGLTDNPWSVRALGGRIVVRLRGCPRRALRPPGGRHRDRRVHHLPRLAVRGRGAQAHRGHGAGRGGGPDRGQPRHTGPDGPQRRGRRRPVRGAGRPAARRRAAPRRTRAAGGSSWASRGPGCPATRPPTACSARRWRPCGPQA